MHLYVFQRNKCFRDVCEITQYSYCSRVISKPHYIYVNLGAHRRLTMIKYNIQDEKWKCLSKTSGLYCRGSWYGPLSESALCTWLWALISHLFNCGVDRTVTGFLGDKLGDGKDRRWAYACTNKKTVQHDTEAYEPFCLVLPHYRWNTFCIYISSSWHGFCYFCTNRVQLVNEYQLNKATF